MPGTKPRKFIIIGALVALFAFGRVAYAQETVTVETEGGSIELVEESAPGSVESLPVGTDASADIPGTLEKVGQVVVDLPFWTKIIPDSWQAFLLAHGIWMGPLLLALLLPFLRKLAEKTATPYDNFGVDLATNLIARILPVGPDGKVKVVGKLEKNEPDKLEVPS